MQCRTKCGLFVAYVAAFGSIAGAVVILLLIKQEGGDLTIGVVSARKQLAVMLSMVQGGNRRSSAVAACACALLSIAGTRTGSLSGTGSCCLCCDSRGVACTMILRWPIISAPHWALGTPYR